MTDVSQLIPGRSPSFLVASPPGAGPQRWAGAPSAALDADGSIVLAYRERHSFQEDSNLLARSADGEHFEIVAELDKERWGFAMVERPALVRTPEGFWRLYASGSDPSSGRWSVALAEAATVEGLAQAAPRTVFPGDPLTTVKDPVVRLRDGVWHAWLCCHPLEEPGAEDRMTTAWATSADGVRWDWRGTVLSGAPGSWNRRGARLTSFLPDGTATFDGRASAEENWRERTGLAVPVGGGAQLLPLDAGPVADVRYLEVLPLPDGGWLTYFEAPLPDGSHELRGARHAPGPGLDLPPSTR